MFRGNFKVAITQGQNEITRTPQATEKGAVATKDVVKSRRSRKPATLTRRRAIRRRIANETQSPLYCFGTVRVAQSGAWGTVRDGLEVGRNELRKLLESFERFY